MRSQKLGKTKSPPGWGLVGKFPQISAHVFNGHPYRIY